LISAILAAAGLAGMAIGLSPDLPVSYRIDATLDTINQKIYGSEEIEFINPTSKAIEKICFHLYANAFSDTTSVFCSENKQVKKDVASGNISRLDITEIMLDDRYVDSSGVTVNGTLMNIDLASGLQPNLEINIKLKFELTIPRAIVRFGRDGHGNYLLSHWYPILCGYQKGHLVDGEYHANSEFFSNFGFYDVTLKLPSNFITGTTGTLNLLENSDSLAVWNATADSVIDFAFACGRNFERFQADTLGIGITYLLSREKSDLFARIDNITKYTLGYCSEDLFLYPYQNFTVVDFSPGSAGLELPGLIAVGIGGPESHRTPSSFESLIVHETAHQWFYATIATNEYDEPWLDEGTSSYYTERIMRSRSDTHPDFSIFGYGIRLDDISRIFALVRHASYPIDLASYEYPNWFEYEAATYARSSMVLQCLQCSLGDTAFSRGIKAYAEKYRFRHPDTGDFEDEIESSSGRDLTEFYSQFVSGTSRVDYAVTDLRSAEIRKETGSDRAFKITVGLRREQDGILRQIVTVRLEDGSKIDTTWDGRSRVAEFQFDAVSMPVYAAIDEYYSYPLDEMKANDRLYYQTHSSRLISFDWDSVFFIEFILSLFL